MKVTGSEILPCPILASEIRLIIAVVVEPKIMYYSLYPVVSTISYYLD